MPLRIVITILCGVGLYVSIFMLRKSLRAERGLLPEPSVVHSPRARLFAGTPNSAIGIIFYLVLGAGIWFSGTGVHAVLCIAALLAAGTSAFLAYSLLFITRMPCPYCWTSHGLNWALVVLVFWNALHPSP